MIKSEDLKGVCNLELMDIAQKISFLGESLVLAEERGMEAHSLRGAGLFLLET